MMQNNTSYQRKIKPQIRIVQANNHFKVILISLKPGAVLEKHVAPERAKIFVVKGTIEYRSLRQKKQIKHLEEYNIPMDEVHQVAANEPAEFLLILG
jgi:quercetin dioxygenase-like cupin family protein